MHPLVKLAREAIETYVQSSRLPDDPPVVQDALKQQAGTFVCIKNRTGDLRGCIGTIEPTQPTLAEEVVRNAISAATRDPRFTPVRPDELDSLEVTVDVLKKPEPVSSLEELDPKRYGVIVEHGWKRGLLLPDLEGVDTPEMQVDIARRKAGIGPDEPVTLYRFEVIRYY